MLFLFFPSSRISAPTLFDSIFFPDYFAERSYYRYISLFLMWPLLERCRGVTFSRIFIPEQCDRITVTVVYCYFCRFPLLPTHRRVLPLALIADFIGITFPSDHIIATFHYVLRDPYQRNGTVSHSTEFLFLRNGAVSTSRLFIVVSVISFCFILSDECDHLFWSQIPSELLFWAIILPIFCRMTQVCYGIYSLSWFNSISYLIYLFITY